MLRNSYNLMCIHHMLYLPPILCLVIFYKNLHHNSPKICNLTTSTNLAMLWNQVCPQIINPVT